MDSNEDTMGVSNDIVFVKDHTNSIGDNDNKNANNHQGIMALVAIMEPATESQAFRAHKQSMKRHHSSKIEVLWNSGSNGDLIF